MIFDINVNGNNKEAIPTPNILTKYLFLQINSIIILLHFKLIYSELEAIETVSTDVTYELK